MWMSFLDSLDGVRNRGLEVRRQLCPAFRTRSPVRLNVAFETQQTEDMLAGQDGRLFERLKTDWARNAKPIQKKISWLFSLKKKWSCYKCKSRILNTKSKLGRQILTWDPCWYTHHEENWGSGSAGSVFPHSLHQEIPALAVNEGSNTNLTDFLYCSSLHFSC